MSSGEVVGKVLQNLEETNMEWNIANFIPMMSKEPGTFYSSPSFVFAEALCCLKIYPNGKKETSRGNIGLYLHFNENHDYLITCEMGLKCISGDLEYRSEYSTTFENTLEYGWENFCPTSELISEKLFLLREGILRVICHVRRSEPRPVALPRLERLQKVSSDLKELLTDNKFTDLVFKFKKRDVHAHKVILVNRSEYFQKMFSHDMVESRTGTITIDDFEPEVFQQVISYIYTGEVDGLCVGNMCQLYVAADKYQLADLKKMCAAFIEKNISADLFYDVVVLADAHNDTGLMQISRDFFIENIKVIKQTEKWKQSFTGDKTDIVYENFLGSTVQEVCEKMRRIKQRKRSLEDKREEIRKKLREMGEDIC